MKNETARYLKITGGTHWEVHPVRFTVPRKATTFQADIWPDSYAHQYSIDADKYFAGENGERIKKTMDPSQQDGVEVVKRKTYKELVAENEQLKARITELEG